MGEQYDVNSAVGCMNFNVHLIVCKQREYDEEHLLVMSLIMSVVAVRNSSQECLE